MWWSYISVFSVIHCQLFLCENLIFVRVHVGIKKVELNWTLCALRCEGKVRTAGHGHKLTGTECDTAGDREDSEAATIGHQ